MIQIMFLASLVATPTTLPAQIAAALPGDTITLRAGNYGTVSILNRRYAKSVQINAADARLSSLTIRNSTGVIWTGGTLIAPLSQTFGIAIADSSKIGVGGMKVSGSRVGLTMSRSTDIDVTGNSFDGVRSDGINIAMSQRVRIVGNACINFRPIRATYSSDGRLLVDGDHADCIQGWSRLGYAPTADITITDNAAEGEMQGISFFDPGQGGYDRITVRNNDLTLRYWNGIVIYEGRGSIVTGNRVRTVPGARAQNWPFSLIRTWIEVTGSRNRVCGNTVEAIPGGEGTQPCQ
jgi:nitrous oxidase accessory protein NosD